MENNLNKNKEEKIKRKEKKKKTNQHHPIPSYLLNLPRGIMYLSHISFL